jgi:hypothetical protein
LSVTVGNVTLAARHTGLSFTDTTGRPTEQALANSANLSVFREAEGANLLVSGSAQDGRQVSFLVGTDTATDGYNSRFITPDGAVDPTFVDRLGRGPRRAYDAFVAAGGTMFRSLLG